jgi:periplasmic protein TonB
MGYLALLFCPDEKTARTVTQVLGELEFTIESCIEPFAAVKKLMGQHFDAVVVDCDNEQNATLLFKSARNSTSNQASLAVAVVEGQAGVAKAFRIGANLVLTKPINIEQAKGTLRVARGLLRKGDPTKPVATAVMPAAAPATPVAKPVGTSAVAAKPVPPLKPAAPTKPTAATTAPSVPAQRPVAPAEVKPASAWPTPAVASAAPVTPGPAANEDDLLEILDDSVSAPAVAARLDTQSVRVPPATAFEAQEAFNAALPTSYSGGAASAPAPAREVPAAQPASQQAHRVGETSTVSPAIPAEAAHGDTSAHSGPAPSFTFGGANVAAEPGGGNKKIFIGLAAAAIVALALYVGWTKFQGGESHTQTPTLAAPATPQSAMPVAEKPTPTTPTGAPASLAPAPVTSTSSANVQHEAVSSPNENPSDKVAGSANAPASSSTKPSNSFAPGTSPASTPASPNIAAEPLIVKGGTAPSIHQPSPVADTPAPDMTGIATAGAGAPPPDLGGARGLGAKPVLQTMKVSQGVSQGLLVKKVPPVYPRNALFMHVEGAVELMTTISKEGDITHVKVLSGDGQLAKAATDAVKQWKYKPYLLNGEPVEIQTEMTINFKLPN